MIPSKPAQAPGEATPARVSYAQSMEDLLLDRLFPDQAGTFMDIGANHPFLDSNTYFFYLRGWRGVNFEPISRNHALFEEHRPGDLNLNVAASDTEGELTFHEIASDEGLTGHSSLMGEVAREHTAKGFAVSSYRVPARTVAGVIAEHRIDPPDFLSLDVEGHEDAVIRGIPWATWKPGALVIEALLPLSHAASHASWEPILLEHGYLFAATNGVNRFYLREDLRDRLPRLQTPVNCLDQYERAEAFAMRGEVSELHSSVQYLQRQYDQLVADREWDRSNFARIQAGWEWGQAQAELARQAWQRDREQIAHERAEFERATAAYHADRAHAEHIRAEAELTKSEFYRSWAAWEWERADLDSRREEAERERDRWRQECEVLHAQLSSTQRVLRPYRLLDRLGVVAAGYRAAQKVKRRLVR